MKITGLSLALLLSGATAVAMPCDTGYLCTSASGKYKIEIQRCRFDNRLGNIVNLEIAGANETGLAKLDSAWDGDKYLAFQVELPRQNAAERIVSVELEKRTASRGILRDKTRTDAPGPWKTDFSEPIQCKISD